MHMMRRRALVCICTLLTPVIGGGLSLIFQVVVDIFVQLFDHRDSTIDTKLSTWMCALDVIITRFISNSSPMLSCRFRAAIMYIINHAEASI